MNAQVTAESILGPQSPLAASVAGERDRRSVKWRRCCTGIQCTTTDGHQCEAKGKTTIF
jgi:hypothetical protein